MREISGVRGNRSQHDFTTAFVRLYHAFTTALPRFSINGRWVFDKIGLSIREKFGVEKNFWRGIVLFVTNGVLGVWKIIQI